MGRGDKKDNLEESFEETMEGLGRNIGRDETVVGETWGFRMEGRVVGGFL